MQQALSAPLALLIPFLTTCEPQDLALHVDAPSRWTTEMTLVGSIEFDELRVSMNGQEIPAEYLPAIDLEGSTEARVLCHESYLRMGAGRALELQREYEEIEYEHDSSMSIVGQNDSQEETHAKGTSVLAGRRIKLTRSAEDSAFDGSFLEDGATEAALELLEGLDADLSWSVLLPEAAIEEGDSWEVEGALLSSLFFPAEDLGLEFEGEEVSFVNVPYYEESFRGALICTWTATSHSDGQRLAQISIEGKLVFTGLTTGDLTHVPIADGPATQEDRDSREVTGQLLWDLDEGMLSSLELTSAIEHESMTTNDEGDMDYEGVFAVLGHEVLTVECRPAD